MPERCSGGLRSEPPVHVPFIGHGFTYQVVKLGIILRKLLPARDRVRGVGGRRVLAVGLEVGQYAHRPVMGGAVDRSRALPFAGVKSLLMEGS